MKKLFQKTLIAFLILIICYAVLFLFIDKSVDTWMHENVGPSFLAVGESFSACASGIFITPLVFVGVLISIVHDGMYERTQVTRVVLLACISIALAEVLGDCLKYFFGRYRPVMLFTEGLYGFHYFGTEWTMRSTPSGHTIRIFALMMSLSLGYKKLAPFFITFAVLVGLSRIVVTAQYPSDVLFGAFIGTTTAIWIWAYSDKKDNRQSG